MTVGLTTADPPEYVYVEAPLGTMVNESPGQIVPVLTVNVGFGFTVTELISTSVQPLELVPVTV